MANATDDLAAQPAPRVLGFGPDSAVEVRQRDDTSWTVLRALRYNARLRDFEVPVDGETDFASVPRLFVWFLPRYGRYTAAAILHDHLWRVVVPASGGDLTWRDADGIFLQAMRELGVPFLRRWIMWAAVRWAALTKRGGRAGWWREAWRVALVTLVALPVVAPPAVLIALALVVFYLMELVAWLPLRLARAVRSRLGRRAKRVNQPHLRWTL
ncbi:DUF1353 domain-containing protein [Phytohabitans kaempferiae]|uniref:DUF1353 domain-containing protein n=1 Tax=Phytohabitans kaempferiae TaxID=1620943 RepID=A0ABV6LZD7_9ACTN